jgi:DNA-binding transcriptional MocR family regulator
VDDLARLKMVGGLTSSEFSERIAFEAATDARWRRHLKTVKDRLAAEHERVAARLIDLGFEIFCESKSGLFLWARHPDCADSGAQSRRAAQHGILMGPGQLFSVTEQVSGWLRFNVAYCDDERIFRFLADDLAQHAHMA